LPFARDGGHEVDGGDEVSFFRGFHHHGLAVVADGEIMVVAGEEHVDKPRADDLVVHVAVGMGDAEDEVGALLAQRRGLRPQRFHLGPEFEVAGLGHVRHGRENEADDADLHGAEGEDLRVLHARDRRAVRLAHIGAK
jgi:hypothetical protein